MNLKPKSAACGTAPRLDHSGRAPLALLLQSSVQGNPPGWDQTHCHDNSASLGSSWATSL